jgi:hypothetical protein
VANIDYEVFVKIWQESNSVAAVMEKSSMKRAAVEHLRYSLKKLGIPLKLMPGSKQRLTPDLVANLNKLCEEKPQ